jgi:hypothetical protein
LIPFLITILAALVVAFAAIALLAHRRGVHRWMLPYLAQARRRRAPRQDQPVHLLLCIADHYEPHNGGVADHTARQRVQAWLDQYPANLGQFRDADGRPPRHTFFYPLEQYDPWEMGALAELCRKGFGEVEIHLHHDRDNSRALRQKLLDYTRLLSDRHALLTKRRSDDAVMYGFVHGDWALDNSRPDGRCCGVNDEIDILRETGCYADFTLPSAPSPTQTSKINSIYYACDDPARPKSHDTGPDAGSGPQPDRSLMLIQGPLLLNWRSRKWGLLPRLENANLQASQPLTLARLDLWLRARVQVPTRPDWYFVKLHTHGAPEHNREILVGPKAQEFHASLARRARDNPNFHVHYVTAREMYNLARAAEAGYTGNVNEARDFELLPPSSSLSLREKASSGRAKLRPSRESVESIGDV